MKTLGGYILMGTAVLACPCHLVVTLPLMLGLLGGTTVGVLLTENSWMVIGLFSAYFVAALWGGMTLFSRRDAAQEECGTCASEPQRVTPVEASRQSAPAAEEHERSLAGLQRR